MMETKPNNVTTGATLTRMVLKISGLKVVSVEPGPHKTDDDNQHADSQQDEVGLAES